MRRQHARGPEHTASDLVVEQQRELRHVPLKRVLQSSVVRASKALASLINLTGPVDHTLNTRTFPLSSDS